MKVSLLPQLISALLVSIPMSVLSQSASLWDGLSPGPYKVGFNAEWKLDYTRTWGQSESVKEDYAAKPYSRPVRLATWYPAAVGSTIKQNEFKDYVFINTTDRTCQRAQSIILKNDLGSENKGLQGLFLGNKKAFENLLNTPVPSYKNASPIKKRRFPLLIYSLGQNDYTLENTIIFEYLASHGFIVVTVPHLGMNPRKDYLLIDDALSYDTQVRDLEFALGEMLRLPNVDPTRIGALGMSMGSVYSLLLSGRNSNIRALAGLDGSVMGGLESFAYKYQGLSYYDSSAVKVPVLQIFRETHHDLSVMRSLRYSDRYLLEIKKLAHADFTSSPLYTLQTAMVLPDTFLLSQRTPEYAATQCKNICEYVRIFFDATLNANEKDRKLMDAWRTDTSLNGLSSTFIPGMQCLNEEEFAKVVIMQGSDSAIEILKFFQLRYPDVVLLRQRKLNRMAYEYVYKAELRDATELFKFNTGAFPKTPAVFDSLGDVYEMQGENGLALLNYEKALSLDPENPALKKSVDRLKQKQ